jgi:hypothetical protein
LSRGAGYFYGENRKCADPRENGARPDGRSHGYRFSDDMRELGASLTITELVRAKALVYRDPMTRSLLELGIGENPSAAQIFGSEPDVMARSVSSCVGDIGCRYDTISTWAVPWQGCKKRRRQRADAAIHVKRRKDKSRRSWGA